jgi:hypothetical protein
MINLVTTTMLPQVPMKTHIELLQYLTKLRECRGDKYLVQYLSLSSKLLENTLLDEPMPIREVIKDKGVNIRICKITGRP